MLLLSIARISNWYISMRMHWSGRYIAWTCRTVTGEGRVSCTIEWPEGKVMTAEQAFIWYAFSLGFAMPVAAISVFYFLVVLRLGKVGSVQQSKGTSRRSRCRPCTVIAAAKKTYGMFSIAERERERERERDEDIHLTATIQDVPGKPISRSVPECDVSIPDFFVRPRR